MNKQMALIYLGLTILFYVLIVWVFNVFGPGGDLMMSVIVIILSIYFLTSIFQKKKKKK